MLDRARTRSDIEWVLGDLQSADWTTEFDLIVMTGHAFQAIVVMETCRNFWQQSGAPLFPVDVSRSRHGTRLHVRGKAGHPRNAVTVEGPDGTKVRIMTEVITPFDGRIVTFRHTFSGEHHSLPQVSTSTLRFHDTDTCAISSSSQVEGRAAIWRFRQPASKPSEPRDSDTRDAFSSLADGGLLRFGCNSRKKWSRATHSGTTAFALSAEKNCRHVELVRLQVISASAKPRTTPVCMGLRPLTSASPIGYHKITVRRPIDAEPR